MFDIQPSAVALYVAAACLIYLTYKDAREFLLPNVGNLILLLSGILFHWQIQFYFITLQSMLFGAISGGLIFLLSYYFFMYFRQVEAVGMGDVKFACAAGVWLGVNDIALMLLISSISLLLLGGIYGLISGKSLQTLKVPYGVAAAPVTLGLILWRFGEATILTNF